MKIKCVLPELIYFACLKENFSSGEVGSSYVASEKFNRIRTFIVLIPYGIHNMKIEGVLSPLSSP